MGAGWLAGGWLAERAKRKARGQKSSKGSKKLVRRKLLANRINPYFALAKELRGAAKLRGKHTVAKLSGVRPRCKHTST